MEYTEIKNKFFLLLGLISFLFFIYIDKCKLNDNIDVKKEIDIANQKHIIDSLTGEIKKATPLLDPNKISDEDFKKLSKENQLFFTELKKYKNLYNASRIDLQKKDSIISSLKNKGIIKGDSICFKLNDSLVFNNDTHSSSDTAFKYTIKINMNEPVTLNFKYQYDLRIDSRYERQKDSILVKYNISDRNVNIRNVNSLMIPNVKEQSFLDKYKWYILPTILGVGFYLGKQ